jgi:ATP-dependent DNA helicase RecQ
MRENAGDFLDFPTRRRVADTLRNVIGPGRRAFFSTEIQDALERAVAELLGEDWESDRSRCDELSRRYDQLAEHYREHIPPEYDLNGAIAYALSYLPTNLHKIQYILLDLFSADCLPTSLKVLDVGAGPGTISVGVLDFLRLLDTTLAFYGIQRPAHEIELMLIDQSQHNRDLALALFKYYRDTSKCADGNTLQFQGLCRTGDFRAPRIADKVREEGPFDLIVFGTCLNEVRANESATHVTDADIASVVSSYVPALAESGSLVLIEPATQHASHRLHRVQSRLVSEFALTVFGPGPMRVLERPESGACTSCWTFRRENVKLPEITRRVFNLDAAPERKQHDRSRRIRDELRYSYTILRRDGRSMHDAIRDRVSQHISRCTSLDNLAAREAEGEGASILAVVASDRLDEPWADPSARNPKKRHNRYRLCDGGKGQSVVHLVFNQHLVPPRLEFGDVLLIQDAALEPGGWDGVDIELVVGKGTTVTNLTADVLRSSIERTDLREPPPLWTLEFFAKRFFGFATLRDGQRATIESLLTGKDALAILPTGGGKSLTFHLPSLILPGFSLVVAPLISLMENQTQDVLRDRFCIDAAACVTSQMQLAEQERVMRMVQEGYVKLLYVSPERLQINRFNRMIRDATRRHPLNLFVVDEAHCVSTWGHDFRPDYLYLRDRCTEFGSPPLLALTATASEKTREDLNRTLRLAHVEPVITSFDRPNLALKVEHCTRPEEKLERLHELLSEHHPTEAQRGPVMRLVRSRQEATPLEERDANAEIIFTRTTGLHGSSPDGAEVLADLLSPVCNGRVSVYHGQLPAERKKAAQADFIRGQSAVLVATNAFGMGVDKRDIGFVVHFTLPASLEAYYQEAGRAGRDDRMAECIVLYAPGDEESVQRLVRGKVPHALEVQAVLDELVARADDNEINVTIKELWKAAWNRWRPNRDQVRELCEAYEGYGPTYEQTVARARIIIGYFHRAELIRVLPTVRPEVRVTPARPRRTAAQLVRDAVQPPEPGELSSCEFIELLSSRNLTGLLDDGRWWSLEDLADDTGLSLGELDIALARLKEQRLVGEVRRRSETTSIELLPPLRDAARRTEIRDRVLDQLETRREINARQLEYMRAYIHATTCRRKLVLDYFQDAYATDRCDFCDVDGISRTRALQTELTADQEKLRGDATALFASAFDRQAADALLDWARVRRLEDALANQARKRLADFGSEDNENALYLDAQARLTQGQEHEALDSLEQLARTLTAKKVWPDVLDLCRQIAQFGEGRWHYLPDYAAAALECDALDEVRPLVEAAKPPEIDPEEQRSDALAAARLAIWRADFQNERRDPAGSWFTLLNA